MICRKCGTEIDENISFCPECGNPAKEQSADETSAVTAGVDSVDVAAETAAASASQNFDWQVASKPAPALQLEKPEKGKAPYIVMGVIGMAILITLVYLIFSLSGVGNPKAYVQKAFLNTWAEMSDRNEYEKLMEKILASGCVKEELNLEMTDFSFTEYGETITLPEEYQPVRISMSSIVNNTEGSMTAELAGGAGDMKDIRLEMFADAEGYMLGLPDLYESYLQVSAEDVEAAAGMDFDLEESMDREATLKAIESVGRTLSKWVKSAYNDVECKKTQKTTLNANGSELKTTEYVLTISNQNYEKHLNKLPEAINNDTVFMGWLTDTLSEAEADEFVEDLRDAVEESMFDSSISEVILCYVQICDNKVVQVSIPLESENEDITGDIVISFFGEKNIADDFRIALDAAVDGDKLTVDYSAVKAGNAEMITLAADMAGVLAFNMEVDGMYQKADNSCTYHMNNVTFTMRADEYAGELNGGMEVSFNGSYTVSKTEKFTVPEDSVKQVLDMSDVEIQEMIGTILINIQEGGYIPSGLSEQFSQIAAALLSDMGDFSIVGDDNDYGDNGGGVLDGSEYLTYEEFAAMVKATYGDMYSDEDLKNLYDSLYGGGIDYDTSDIVYGPSGLPYLFCYEEDLILEIQPMEGFVFAPDFSTSYAIEYEKTIGDNDLIIMDYEITEDTMEEYLQWQIEFQKKYYTEQGYEKVEISDIQYGIIGGFRAAWFEYSAKTEEDLSTGIIAFAQVDDVHGCAVDMYSLYGVEKLTQEMLFDSFNMHFVEN